MGFLSWLLGDGGNEHDDSIERDISAYGLDEDEADFVRKGLNDPWDFSEEREEMDEDDYYSEDDL